HPLNDLTNVLQRPVESASGSSPVCRFTYPRSYLARSRISLTMNLVADLELMLDNHPLTNDTD
ncbi:MAG: hypothetical protein ACO2Y9_10455, partial [Pseudohongiellaceae bacterium]